MGAKFLKPFLDKAWKSGNKAACDRVIGKYLTLILFQMSYDARIMALTLPVNVPGPMDYSTMNEQLLEG